MEEGSLPNGLHTKGGSNVQENYVVALLRQINSSLPGDTEKRPEEISELSLAQIYLLGELFQVERTGREPLSLSELSRENGFSKATVCATLKKLRKGGFVRMQTDDSDNRRKEISLTQRAWQLEPYITQYISALDRALCAGISSKDLKNMEQSLQTILQNTKNSESKPM